MATEILRPSAAGDETNLTIGGTSPAPTNWQSVDEAVADDVVTDVGFSGTLATRRDFYNLQNPVVSAGRINSVTVYFRYFSMYSHPTVLGWGRAAIKSGGVPAVGTEYGHTDGLWHTHSHTWVTPPEGGSWTLAKIIALQAGVSLRCTADKSSFAWCTQVYVVVDYTAGWLGTISTVVDPAKIAGVAWTAINKVKTVVSRA